MNECIICEKVGGKLVEKPTESSIETLFERTRQKHRYWDQAVANFAEQTVDISPATPVENHATYHWVCYSNYTNKSKIDRAKKRYPEAVETGDTPHRWCRWKTMIQLGIYLKVATFLPTSPFTAIGADHGIEQQKNHSLKVLGSIERLKNKQQLLDEYFLAAGKTLIILDDFPDHFNIKPHQEVTEHYQLTGSKIFRKCE